MEYSLGFPREFHGPVDAALALKVDSLEEWRAAHPRD
jgi:hypothetical protein